MKKRKQKTQLFTFSGRICQTAEKTPLYWLTFLFATKTLTSTILSLIHYFTEKTLHSVDNSCAKLSKGFERLFFFNPCENSLNMFCMASSSSVTKTVQKIFSLKNWLNVFWKRKKKNVVRNNPFEVLPKKTALRIWREKKVTQLLIHFFFLYLNTNSVLLLKDFCLH